MHQLLMSPVSSADISDVMDTSVESCTPMPDDITVPEDEPKGSIALHLPIAYDKTPAICNNDHKFAAFPHSIL